MTTKGQITIPKKVRTVMGLSAGDRVFFHLREDGVVEIHSRSVDLGSLAGMAGSRGRTVTLEEMDETVRAAAARAFQGPGGKGKRTARRRS